MAPVGPVDGELRRRAAVALPAGVYGHVKAGERWPGSPQFVARAAGSRFWDVDGREYLDLLCSWGPIILGHRHPEVEEAVAAQHALVDCGNGPAPAMVDLAERLVGIVDHADWAMFAKNGSDATTLCLTLARAATGRKTILVAAGAYHGAPPWCTPEPVGVVPGDRAHLSYYRYNDLESVRAAMAAAPDDVAGIIVSPFRHDAGFDQELPDPAFARGLRELCDATGALLILDDVRCGLRIAFGGSWEPLGVAPDLSAWSKAIANGYPLAAVLGSERVRAVAAAVFATGSFWFAADAMAASLATLAVLEREGGVAAMRDWGRRFRDGVEATAAAKGLEINMTGEVTMPYLSFPGDEDRALADVFAAACADGGLFVHPRHNWFVSAALDDADLDLALSAVGAGFEAVATVSARA
ncbi:MAG: aminotransferase class III-fold pyridoxal phosphate-dependent enzyme [Actinobacteria bacterium]|nr:aminotransferase class III-fold pyridoxal phosphate-dependent enzyme [Actinomycetota bacterium]